MTKKFPAHERGAPRGDELGADDEVFRSLMGSMGRDALRYLPAVLVPAAASMLSIVIFTRLFGSGRFGEYSLVIAVVAITISVIAGWLQQSIIRYLPRFGVGPDAPLFIAKVNVILWVTVGVVVVLSIAAYVVFEQRLGVYQRFYTPAVVLLVVWMFFMIYCVTFQALLRSSRYAGYHIAYAVGRILFALGFVYLVSRDVVGLVVGSAAAYAVLVVPMMWELGLLRKPWRSFHRLDLALLRRFLAYGLPVVGSAVALRLLELSDRFVIAAFRGTGEVGIYSANYLIAAAIIGFVATPIMLAADPLVTRSWEGGNERRIRELISDFSRYFLLAVSPVAAFVCVYASKIARVAFADEYHEGYVVIPVVVAAIFVWSLSMYGNKGVKLAEKTAIMFASLAICAAANIALNFVFVPPFGYFGAAVATLLSYLLYAAIIFLASRRYVAWVLPWRSIARIAAASAVTAVFWWFLRFDFAIGLVDWIVWLGTGLVGAVIYLLMLILTGELRPYEKRLIKRGLRGGRA